MGTTPFLDEVPDYSVRDETMYITKGDFALAMPLRVFEHGMAKARRAVDEYRAQKAVIVPIKGKRRAAEH